MEIRNYFEAMIQQVEDKITEQEICLQFTEDINVRQEIRFRLASLLLERQSYRQMLQNMKGEN